MRRKRPLLVAVSLSVHLVVVLGLFVAGFWRLDRLDAPRRTIDLAVAPPPPPAPSGSPSAAEPEPFTKQKPMTLMAIRTVDDELWGARYQGPPHVVFGHNAPTGIQIHRWATGLDSGCVYGGALTAMVLDANQKVPAGREARWKVLVSERARKMWFVPKNVVA